MGVVAALRKMSSVSPLASGIGLSNLRFQNASGYSETVPEMGHCGSNARHTKQSQFHVTGTTQSNGALPLSKRQRRCAL
jgi:hypothetical protein